VIGRRDAFALAGAMALVASCQSTAVPSPPVACVTAAQNYNGQVVGFTVTTLRVVRGYTVVGDDPALAGVSPDEPAYMCYIDGQIGMAPPPQPNATPSPPFDRAIVIAGGGTNDLVTAGYREDMPLPSAAIRT
jgi:hypothetical protein